MGQERTMTYSKKDYLGGVASQKGPEKPYVALGGEQAELICIRKITSKLGFLIEESTVNVLSGKINIDPDCKSLIATAFSNLSHQLTAVKHGEISSNPQLLSFYRELTLPPEIPWDGRERRLPTNRDLIALFIGVDEVFGSTFLADFKDIGRSEKAMDFIYFRYYVEGAMALARLVIEPLPAMPGLYYPDVRLYKDGKNVTQFDAILTPYRRMIRNFDLIRHIHKGMHWSDIQVKSNLRARYVAGTGKLMHPFARDIREALHQIAKTALLAQGKGSILPDFISLYYIRGLQPNALHHIRVDRPLINSWAEVLWNNIREGEITDPEQLDEAFALLSLIENTDLIKKKYPNGKRPKQHKFLKAPIQSTVNGFFGDISSENNGQNPPPKKIKKVLRRKRAGSQLNFEVLFNTEETSDGS